MAHFDYGGGVKNTKKYDYVICERSLMEKCGVLIERLRIQDRFLNQVLLFVLLSNAFGLNI